MRISTFWYCLKQGVVNICRNILFSLASMATISACIFLFCLFFSLVANVQSVARAAESTVGITVFFDEALPEEQILLAGEIINGWDEIKNAEYVSADQAWDNFQTTYFEGMEELAQGFAEDNPLAGSASYNIFLSRIEDQQLIVERLKSMDGVRKVEYSSAAASGFVTVGKMIGVLSLVIIGVLLAVSVFLISNTISVAAAFRRRENEIMRLIGATNYMIRAPFVVEGLLLGAFGAAIPLAGICYLYERTQVYLEGHFQLFTNFFNLIPLEELLPYMAGASAVLGVGIGFFVSFFTIHRHLKV